MQQLSIYFLKESDFNNSIERVADHLRNLNKHVIAHAPWKNYPYKPEVYFAISYNHHSIFLQYLVKENFIKAAFGRINDPVYQDSCVEFFVSLDYGSTYYNFEFNCIGNVLGGFGKEKENRQQLPEKVLNKVRSQVIIDRGNNESGVRWEITIAIPFKAFLHHPLSSLQGQQCRANFYKCGDGLPEPHFLSWTDIKSSEPNFHLPDFFGVLKFE